MRMFQFLQDLRRYGWAHALWIARPRKAWLCVAVILVALLVTRFATARPDDHLRYAGLVLQLVGVGTVAYLLRDKRVTFARKSLLSALREWAAARPRFRPRTVTLQVSGAAHAHATSHARLSVWRNVPRAAAMEERFAALEANLAELRTEHSETSSRLSRAQSRLSEDLTAERRERENADRASSEKLEKLGAAGLHIEAIGLIWLVTGIVLATIPAELAKLVGLMP